MVASPGIGAKKEKINYIQNKHARKSELRVLKVFGNATQKAAWISEIVCNSSV